MDTKKYKNILIVSRSAWRDDNSIGNTLSNLFRYYPAEKISNLFVREDLPQNSVCRSYFKYSEVDILGGSDGKMFHGDFSASIDSELKDITKNRWIRFFRSFFLLWLREFIWLFRKRDNLVLDAFIEKSKPQLLFAPVYDSIYMHCIVRELSKKYGLKIVLYHCDDYLSYNCYSWSPFFWINRFFLSSSIRKLVSSSSLNYCISEKQSKVYFKIFDSKIKFYILYKSAYNIKRKIRDPTFSNAKREFNILYAGNLEGGRDETLKSLVDVLKSINSSQRIHLFLSVYSPTTNKFFTSDSSVIKFYNAISYDLIKQKIKHSDFLLHLESFNRQHRLATALSFSTKIVDYLEAQNCIIAIGWAESASISYLEENKCAIVINDINQAEGEILSAINSSQKIFMMEENAYNLLISKHSSSRIIERFYSKLIEV